MSGDEGPGPGSDDVLDLGPRRESRLTARRNGRGRAVRVALWSAGVLAVAGAFVAQLGNDSPARRHPTATPSTAAPSVRPAVSATQVALEQVAALADRATPLADFVRQTSPAHACRTVAVGRSPVRSATAVLTAALPAFVVDDVGRTLDQFTGLCSLQLRAVRPDGAVLVLSVAAPSPSGSAGAGGRTGEFDNGANATRFATRTTPTHWLVLVGVTGAAAGLPGRDELARLAGRSGLTW